MAFYTPETALKISQVPAKANLRIQFEQCHFRPNTIHMAYVYLGGLSVEGGYGWHGFEFESCYWDRVQLLQKTPWKNWLLWVMSLGIRLHALPGENYLRTTCDVTTLDRKCQIYDRLKTAAKSEGNRQLESDFHAWRMLWDLRDRTNNGIHWVVNVAYNVLSFYGTSIVRPLLWLVVLWAGTALYFDYLMGTNDLWTEAALSESFQHLFLFSFNLDFLKEDSPENLKTPGIVTVLYLLKASSVFLLFQLGAAIRNKVKQ